MANSTEYNNCYVQLDQKEE